jgi:hypothetical protein
MLEPPGTPLKSDGDGGPDDADHLMGVELGWRMVDVVPHTLGVMGEMALEMTRMK